MAVGTCHQYRQKCAGSAELAIGKAAIAVAAIYADGRRSRWPDAYEGKAVGDAGSIAASAASEKRRELMKVSTAFTSAFAP
jgi:hypothetical protein